MAAATAAATRVTNVDRPHFFLYSALPIETPPGWVMPTKDAGSDSEVLTQHAYIVRFFLLCWIYGWHQLAFEEDCTPELGSKYIIV